MDDFIGKKRGCPVQNNKVHQVISQELDDIRSQTGLIPIWLRPIKAFECCRIYVNPATFESLDRSQPYGYQAGLTANIIQLLRYNLVDLVILNRATPLLAYEIIHNGILLFACSEDIRVKFEISSLKRHADTKHLRDIKRIYSKILMSP